VNTTKKTRSMSRATALENMVIARDVLEQRGIPVFLTFGTLLGAVREHDFIPHDEDVDMHIFEKDEQAFRDAFPALEAHGLKLRKRVAETRRYTFARGGEDVDFFLAREVSTRNGGRAWDLEGRMTLPSRHLDTLESIEFLGQRFSVPSDPLGVVRILYGKTWNVPIAHRPSQVGFKARYRKLVAHPEKALFYLHRFITMRLRWGNLARRVRREQKTGKQR
jgi:lipopolysaccharide cholinephosphotransferase